MLLVGRYRWVIRVGFGATDDFESTGNGGYGSYSEGVVLRQAMSTVVRRGSECLLEGAPYVDIAWGLVLCRRPFIIGTRVLPATREYLLLRSYGAAVCIGGERSRGC